MGGCQHYGSFLGNIRVILGLYGGYMGDNGKENGNYYHGYMVVVKIMVPFWVP